MTDIKEIKKSMGVWLEDELGGRLVGNACYDLASRFVDRTYQLFPQPLTDEELEGELAEMMLKVRQYLLSTEFAPEPFYEPLDIDELKVRFPKRILALLQTRIEKSQEEVTIKTSDIYGWTDTEVKAAIEKAKKATDKKWIKALMRGGIMVSAPEQLAGCAERIAREERERIYKEGYPQHYYPAHPRVWAETMIKHDGYKSGLAAFLNELSERWQALTEPPEKMRRK